MIGIDLVEIAEFKRQLDLGGDTFIKKSFNLEDLANQEIDHLAGIWAAREAVAKAMTLELRKYTDIVISYDQQGKPRAKVYNQLYEISIAHHGDYAVAIALRKE